MRVNTSTPPVVRVTAVDLTDREIALLARATFKTDVGQSGPLQQDNDQLWNELDSLRQSLGIADLDLRNDGDGDEEED